MKKALFYKTLSKSKKVQCRTCSHFCILDLDQKGRCGVRKNVGGKLYTLTYGKAAALGVDPIEKKPLFHFLPGTDSLSLATVGCPFFCKNCQNWELSQGPKENEKIYGDDISPKEIVEFAKEKSLPSISYTYTDVTAFLEYALETMKLAKKEGVKNVFVTNGYISKEALEVVVKYLDAVNVDIKSFSEKFYKDICKANLKPVLENLKFMKKFEVWIEITTLVIPTLSDSEKMFKEISKFIYNELGSQTPWHLSKFSGEISWKLQNISETPTETLEKGYEIGKDVGLKYIYLGNLGRHKFENTYCSNCETLCIDRTGFGIIRYDKKGLCPKCKNSLDLILK